MMTSNVRHTTATQATTLTPSIVITHPQTDSWVYSDSSNGCGYWGYHCDCDSGNNCTFIAEKMEADPK